ncbi:MAG TPA: DNA repair protein RecO [Acidimicrobiia bacterium]|nr:DNA repair protein RecO [Acidimicrobiia bacterium]
MALYRDRGVVLRTIKLGEADRIVSILTQGNGKIRAVAKGIRRPGSRFGARLEPTSHVALQCYQGRELDVVTQVETIDAFRPLREHYGSLTHAVSMLEAADSVAQERERNHPLYRMLVGGLRTLATNPSPLVAPAFFWKLLSLEGFHPLLAGCARCGASEESGESFPGFDFGEGGVLCEACARFGGRRVRPAALGLLRRILGGALAGALAEHPGNGEVVLEVERLGVGALEYHLERRLRSAALL